ncbi:hypothetical protein C2G38_2170265 [Gigaspora rosea]|uniref:Uncharacterized protein n=1 Tax=Gigaspora rosea TaxID=44941 RepID=A0A397VPD8_9GLOM|nr:hypothetical protein C2G38_2170265 [Gigaspora rosea]
MLTLNVIEIHDKSAKLSNLSLKTNQSQNAINISYDTQKQTVSLTFPEELPTRSKVALHLEFTGILTDQMCATDARRVFPSWDEPAIKATFDITLIIPSELTALINMNVISENPHNGGKKCVKFATTTIMSTYYQLIAFIVGDLVYVETSTTGLHNGGKPVWVLFGIPYPLQKCDMVAIPDFEAGAMENWGLITYRTTAILFDPKASDAKFKQCIAYTVLMEGFQRGLQLDALRSSHPIEVPVNDPSEIHQIFDAISYFKDASVIRMLSNFIGENIILAGIRRYLKRHEYSNASTDDLWKALTEESGIDVGQFMKGWTKVVGYPVLTVTEPSHDTIHINTKYY